MNDILSAIVINDDPIFHCEVISCGKPELFDDHLYGVFLFVCLFGIFRPTREFFIDMET